MARPKTSKSERIDLRLDEAIRAHETMVLGKRDTEVFLDAIVNPSAPNEKLRRAMKEHRRRVVSRYSPMAGSSSSRSASVTVEMFPICDALGPATEDGCHGQD